MPLLVTIALVVSAIYVAVTVSSEGRGSRVIVASVNWNNPSGYCFPSTSSAGFDVQANESQTVSLRVVSSSGLVGCYVQGVKLDTPGFTVVESNTPGMLGTWEPLSLTIEAPKSFSGQLNITIDVIPVEGDSPVPQLALASSNVVVNSTGGYLLADFVNIGNSSATVGQVTFDGAAATSSSSRLDNTCMGVASEESCTLEFYFGAGLLPVPPEGTENQLSLRTSAGAAMTYSIPAGEQEFAWSAEL